ncbi:MAG: hypothetical protein AAF530_20750 [Pseudomonadota bacterium]
MPVGILAIDGEKFRGFDPYGTLCQKYANLSCTTYTNRLVLPDFIDSHIHYPQIAGLPD